MILHLSISSFLVKLCFVYAEFKLLGTKTLSSWQNDPFIIMKYHSSSPVTFLALKSILFDTYLHPDV